MVTLIVILLFFGSLLSPVLDKIPECRNTGWNNEHNPFKLSAIRGFQSKRAFGGGNGGTHVHNNVNTCK
jgi:hypothetical protein